MTLWADTVAKNTESTRAQMNYGVELMKVGKMSDAESRFRETVRLAPQYNFADLQAAVAHSKVPARELKALAETLVRAGRMQEARQAVERGSALDPNLFGELRAKVGVQG